MSVTVRSTSLVVEPTRIRHLAAVGLSPDNPDCYIAWTQGAFIYCFEMEKAIYAPWTESKRMQYFSKGPPQLSCQEKQLHWMRLLQVICLLRTSHLVKVIHALWIHTAGFKMPSKQ
ncbi:uncharacterized protein LOC144115282 isoform X2 [Amblyomma americanum]